MSEKLPSVELLPFVRVEEDPRTGLLICPKLDNGFEPGAQAWWDELEQAEAGSVTELKAAEQLAWYYLKHTAQATLRTGSPELWAPRFNEAAAELFGEPDKNLALQIASEDVEEIINGNKDSNAANLYLILAKRSEGISGIETKVDLGQVRAELEKTLPGAFEYFGYHEDREYTSVEIREIFNHIKDGLSLEYPELANWRFTNPEGKTNFSVRASKKEIEIPDARMPVGNKAELMGLFFHEVGVHVLRSVNGSSFGDDMTAIGLPRYSDFEEGFGVLVEAAILGHLPDKVKDRYLDVALVSGTIDGIRLDRHELLEFYVSREQARSVARGVEFDIDSATASGKSHVNRLFRGTPGEAIRDRQGRIVDQPVFGRDILYFAAFTRANEYIAAKLEEGHSFSDAWQYILSAKFDPANQAHVDYMANQHNISLA